MFKLCKHSTCAVCTDIKEREVFQSILKTMHPETYVCEHASYAIKSFVGGEFIIPSLEFIRNSSNGYYVRDMYTGGYIFLNKDNLRVVCTKQGRRCEKTPFVAEYTVTKKGS